MRSRQELFLAGAAAFGLIGLEVFLVLTGNYDAGITQSIVLSITAIITGTGLAVVARKMRENIAKTKNGSEK
jgi:hypothetical protein